MQHRLWLLVGLVFSIHTYASDVSILVENGNEVSAGDPLRTAIARLTTNSGSCSASFLNDTTLLTAGHCVKSGSATSNNASVRVRAANGTWYTQNVRTWIRHPNYRLENSPLFGYRVANDFAILKLRAPLNTAVRSLQVGDPSQMNTAFEVIVAGYGKVGPNTSSRVLRKGRMRAEIRILPEFFNARGLYMTELNNIDQFTCAGDSGGPVILNNASGRWLIGVHSLSSGCLNDPAAISFSQLPALVISWIERNL